MRERSSVASNQYQLCEPCWSRSAKIRARSAGSCIASSPPGQILGGTILLARPVRLLPAIPFFHYVFKKIRRRIQSNQRRIRIIPGSGWSLRSLRLRDALWSNWMRWRCCFIIQFRSLGRGREPPLFVSTPLQEKHKWVLWQYSKARRLVFP